MDYKVDVDDLAAIFALGNHEIDISEDGSETSFHFSKGRASFKEEHLKNEVTIVESHYQFNENMELNGRGSMPLLEMQFNLTPSSIYYENDVSKSPLVAGMSGNILFDAENSRAKIGFKKDIVYHTFDLHLPPALLFQYQGECKEMDLFLDAIHRGKSMLFRDQSIAIDLKMLRVIEDIKQCPYSGITRKIYLEGKVYELIALSLDSIDRQRETITLSSYDKEQILLAGELIRKNISQPYTIQQLGSEVGINQNKLKQGFKAIFGTTPFSYLQEIRMNQAQQYLLDTDMSLQEISLRSGYNHLSNFSTAFKRIFGYAPAEVRKRQ